MIQMKHAVEHGEYSGILFTGFSGTKTKGDRGRDGDNEGYSILSRACKVSVSTFRFVFFFVSFFVF